MNREEYQKAIHEVIYLVSCAVNETIPDKTRIEKAGLVDIYKAADKHMLTSVTAFALESAGIKNTSFTQAKGKAIRKTAAMDIDKQLLFECFEQEKIWYMPLKGMVLKDFYPSFGMRQMSDFDILFDQNCSKKVKEIMQQLGFTVEHFGVGNHDVYFKQPVSNFEMHTGLFSPSHEKKIYHYYSNVKERLIKDADNQYGYHFSNEDFYIYITAHEYKHFSQGGTGLRSLADVYVLLKKCGKDLDMDYVTKEAEKLGISEFEKKNRHLAMKLFSGEELADGEQKMLEYIIFSGTYGNIQNSVINKTNELGSGKKGKAKYILQRFFLPMDKVQTMYPFFYKHKLLLPVLFFYRLGRSVTVSRKKVKSEFNQLKKIK